MVRGTTRRGTRRRGTGWTTKGTTTETNVGERENDDPLVAYREDWSVLRVVTATKGLVEVSDTDDVLDAASYVEDDGFTPFDALHLVKSGDDAVVSSGSDYDGFAERVGLEEAR